MLKLHTGILSLFRISLQITSNTKIFLHNMADQQVVNPNEPSRNRYEAAAQPFVRHRCKVSAICPVPSGPNSGFYQYQHGLKTGTYDERRSRVEVVAPKGELDWWLPGVSQKLLNDMAMIKPPEEAFHYAFSFPSLNDDGTFRYATDHLRHWQISRSAPEHKAPAHLMALEAMLHATLPAGFFGAVLPRRWMGSNMQWMKWWNENAPLVAKVQLPRHAIERWIVSEEDIEFDQSMKNNSRQNQADIDKWELNSTGVKAPMISTGNWMLFIWQKPVFFEEGKGKKHSRRSALQFASIRYSSHVAKLRELDETAVEACTAAFRKSDWSRYSVRPYQTYLAEGGDSLYAYETYEPVVIRSPSEMRIIRVSDVNKPRFYTKKTPEEIGKVPLAVQIVIGPPVKLYGHSPQTNARLLDLCAKSGFSQEELTKQNRQEGYAARDSFTARVKDTSFIDNRDWLLKTLNDAGLVPYMTEAEANRLEKQERWLNIQLTPIPRTIRVPAPEDTTEKPKEAVKEEEVQEPLYGVDVSGYDLEIPNDFNVDKDVTGVDIPVEKDSNGNGKPIDKFIWEVVYDDVDLKSTFPELWSMWESRARKMKLHVTKFTYDYQLEDIIYAACKQSILLGNVMGLGKTREMLFTALLRGVEHTLIIVPTLLVGIWQEEIETTIANYVRLVRRNWMGKIMSADVQVIEWARDCMPENLKTFNLISSEKLAAIPKDALFFQCATCKFVVCSPSGHEEQACPKCNHRRRQALKESNLLQGLRKRKVFSEKLNCIVEEDPRVSTGKPILMEPVENVFKKMVRQQVGTQTVHKNGIKVEEPVYRDVDRSPHLKWTFSELLRGKFSFVAADEANYYNNPATNRSFGLDHITARSRQALTGTPLRGYPRNACNTLNWCFRRLVFPDYRQEGSNRNSGVMKFQKKYATYVESADGKQKLIPKINNPELFQQELAPLMIRHLRHEPNVAKQVPPKTPNIRHQIVPMDPHHREYYQKWLDAFAEWWRLKRLEQDKQQDAKTVNDLLVKITYLINASTIPHFMMEDMDKLDMAFAAIPVYTYKQLPAKFLYAGELIKKHVAEREKTMVGCWRTKNLHLGTEWCRAQKPPIKSLRIDGTVSNAIKPGKNRSAKQLLVDAFCYQDYDVMWASTSTMKEGFNIPQCNHAILMDYTWENSDTDQFIGRMLRPAQKHEVDAVFLCHEGTADEYVAALSYLKGRSSAEGVDYTSFDDFCAQTMVPDFMQYANAIVDGNEKELKQKMWTMVERLKKEAEEE